MPAIKLMKYVEKKKKEKKNCSKRTQKRAQARMHSQAAHAHLFLRFCAVRFITGFLLPEFAFYQTKALSAHGFKAKLL